jgi:type II secretory pathway pseudopilin PulG
MSRPPHQPSARRIALDHHRHGMTLVEVLVAVGLMAGLLLTMLVSLQMGFRLNDSARRANQANQVLLYAVEDLRARSFDDPVLAVTTGAVVQPIPTELRRYYTRRPHQFSEIYHATRRVTSGRPDMKEVEIEVTWVDIRGRTQRRSIQTQMARTGLNHFFANPIAATPTP